MVLTVKDISMDLGVTGECVRHWIAKGRLKGIKESRKSGYRIQEEDYNAFLKENERWRQIHNGIVFSRKRRIERMAICSHLEARILVMWDALKKESHPKSYVNGWERAAMDIQNLLRRECGRKADENGGMCDSVPV